MPDVAVARLHARYRGADDPTRHRLDRALHALGEGALADALTDEALPRWLTDAHAVCIRRLTATLDLDPAAPTASVGGRWADAIGAALAATSAADPDVVVYPTPLDAVADLTGAVVAGSDRRSWALHQVGLLPTDRRPAAADLAAALVAHPALVPGVLARAGTRKLPLTPAEWLTVAAAFVAAVTGGRRTPVVRAPRLAPLPRAALDAAVAALSGTPAPRPSAGRARVAVPDAAFAAAADDGQAVALAALDLAVTDPAACADPDRLVAVASTARASTGATATPHEEGDDTTIHPDGPGPVDEARAAAVAADDAAELTDSDADVLDASDPEAVATDRGGVAYLLHLLDGGAPEVLARACARLTDSPVDDPAVLLVAGWTGDDVDALHAPADPATRLAVDALVADLDTALDERLAAADATDVDWASIWARDATIAVQPGWIEVSLPLAAVDVRLRMAGLDLDPGYVWWLGAVVRFRHV